MCECMNICMHAACMCLQFDFAIKIHKKYTSYLHTYIHVQVLAHRIGLVPIRADPDKLVLAVMVVCMFV